MGLEIDLSGKRAFVSGVTSGIGAAIAKTLAQAGCDVAGCGRGAADQAGAANFIQSVEIYGSQALYLKGDLSNEETPKALISETIQVFQGIDILVSNAGRNIFRGAKACSNSDWEECMNLDLAAHWRLSQAAYPHLIEATPGVIVIIGSNHGWTTMPGCFPYNVAKAGLKAMVQSFAIEWGPNIRTVGIAPGFIETAGNQTWFDSFDDPAAERARTESLHPVGRIGSAEEIACLCAFLASPMSGFTSGTTLCIDGGRSAVLQDL